MLFLHTNTKAIIKFYSSINDWSEDESRIKDGKKVPLGFTYNSSNNDEWMTKNDLQDWINKNINDIKID